VQALSARQQAATMVDRAAAPDSRRARGRTKERVGLDAGDGATDMRARYTLALDLH